MWVMYFFFKKHFENCKQGIIINIEGRINDVKNSLKTKTKKTLHF